MACVQPLEDHQHPPHPSTTLVHKQPHPPLSPTPLASTQAVDDTDGQLRSFNTPLYSSGLHPVLGSQGDLFVTEIKVNFYSGVFTL